MKIISIGLFLLLTLSFAQAAKLRPFTTDYCSSFPDGVPGVNPELWATCCYEHDVAYWMGGTSDEKNEADRRLNICVAERTGSYLLGGAMELGVWVGGGPDYDTTYRWGYGWDKPRPYGKLSLKERSEVERVLSNSCERNELQRIIIKVMKRKGLRYTGFQPI